jgi:sugar phosphate isomerase/epimerase
MQIGVADYGMNVWDGGCYDTEERLIRLQEIGYDGIERLEAVSADQALYKAVRFRRLGLDYATCRGPNPEVTLQWTAALGKAYVWVSATAREFSAFCRQANIQAAACRRWGIRAGLHNHLGTPVETQEQLEAFLEACPDCGLILDTAHLAAAGGDPVEIVNRYSERLTAIHLKDWITLREEVGLENWTQRGRFCELGAGNIGLDNAAVLGALRKVGYDGWIFVEQDTHLQDPLRDLAISREYIRQAGF